jgi:hypothetical protein
MEALQVAGQEYVPTGKPVLLVEGIYDKYAVQLFMAGADEWRVLPGTGADSLIKNIQFLNAFGQLYVSIWDNDEEGRRTRKKAEEVFGALEARAFDLLPSRGGGKNRRMEDMFDPKDLEMLQTELGLPSEATYESILGTLYYSARRRRSALISKCGPETLANFQIVASVVKKRAKSVEELRAGRDDE